MRCTVGAGGVGDQRPVAVDRLVRGNDGSTIEVSAISMLASGIVGKSVLLEQESVVNTSTCETDE